MGVPNVNLYCPQCGYDLRGNTTDKCSECGEMTDERSMLAATVPWTNRAELGRVRALIQTAWNVTFRTNRFCLALPINYRDARRFQLVVVSLVWVASVTTAKMIFSTEREVPVSFPILGEDLARYTGIMLSVGWFVFLLLATGVHTYWFHPRSMSVEQQNRAVSLSYYACAPLLWVVPALMILVLGLRTTHHFRGFGGSALSLIGVACSIVAVVLIGTMLVGVWINCLKMAGRLTGSGLVRRLSLLIAQPILVALLFMVTVVVPPYVIGSVRLLLNTL